MVLLFFFFCVFFFGKLNKVKKAVLFTATYERIRMTKPVKLGSEVKNCVVNKNMEQLYNAVLLLCCMRISVLHIKSNFIHAHCTAPESRFDKVGVKNTALGAADLPSSL